MNPTNQEEKLAVVMSSFPTNPTKVYELGILITKLIEVQCSSSSSNNQRSPPRPLLIFSPSEAGVFPVVLFLHGYLLYNSFYSQLLHHVASHGYIVVAPQLYLLAGPDASEEIKMTSEISRWLSEGLSPLLPIGVKPNMAKLALAGHSRGGKVAFSAALNQTSSSYPKFSALIGVDPVDGSTPPVLTNTPNSLNPNGTPVLIIGSGYGEEKTNPFFPPCAPKGFNHEEFYNECKKPVYHFVADYYGHLDMLDDDTKGIVGKATYCMCKHGESRGQMRKYVGGIMVAFLEAYLGGDSRELVAISEEKVNNVPLQMKSAVRKQWQDIFGCCLNR